MIRSPKAGPSPRMPAARGVHGASQPRVAGPSPGDDVFRASGPRHASPAPGEDRRHVPMMHMPSTPGREEVHGPLEGPKAGIMAAAASIQNMASNAASMAHMAGLPSIPGVPRLDIHEKAPANPPQLVAHGPHDVNLGAECEDEIDRLVRERLEGGHSHRVNAKKRLEGFAEYHNTWQGCVEASIREAAWSILQGIQEGPQVLLGRLNLTGPNSACNRMAKVMPVVIPGDGEADVADVNAPPPELAQVNEDEDFKDLIAPPAAVTAAVRDPVRPFATPMASSSAAEVAAMNAPPAPPAVLQPERTPPLTAPASSSGGSEPTESALPRPEEASNSARGKRASNRRPDANASVMSVSSAMTSSAAQVLGGLAQPQKRNGAAAPSSSARPEPVSEEPSNAASSSEAYEASSAGRRQSPGRENPRPPNDSKSVLASNTGMTSSAAAALGPLAMGGGASRRSGGGGARSASPRDAKSTSGASNPGSSGPSMISAGIKSSASAGRKSNNGSRPGGDQKTVVSGMQSTSAASAILGPLAQQGGRRRSADDTKSVM